jgi:uncharacterized membrane protein YgcG
MKPLLLLLAFSAIIISSCTTAYKTGQTPDDVYYSPVRPQEEYVRVDNIDNRTNGGTEQYYEDRQLRMKVHNPTRWSELDDWYYYNNRYNYFGNYNPLSWNNPWNNYTYWNYYYNPYCPRVIMVNPKSVATYNKPRVFNLNTYNNPPLNNNYNGKNIRNAGNNNNNSNDSYNTNSRRDAGSTLRDIFRGSNNNNSGSSSSSHPNSSSNTSSNSGSSGGSSGSSSSGNAPVRKF